MMNKIKGRRKVLMRRMACRFDDLSLSIRILLDHYPVRKNTFLSMRVGD
jgi:hypothetical protein